jgi:hypothetical protein
MPLKDLLVCFDRTDAGYARLELAFNLAHAVGHISPALTFYRKRTPRPPVRSVLGSPHLPG